VEACTDHVQGGEIQPYRPHDLALFGDRKKEFRARMVFRAPDITPSNDTRLANPAQHPLVLFSLTASRSLLAAAALRSAAGDAARIERLVEQHVDAVWRSVRYLGIPRRDLEDVVQEVMLVVVRRIADIEPARERAFVLGTALRVSANWRRSRGRRPEDLSDAMDDLGPNTLAAPSGACASPERLAERNEKLALLAGALERMSEAQRSAFIMFELEQMTASEIARELELPEAAIVSRVRRAREVFRTYCEQKGQP
jgi:RNA polymerase sigma-70 factor, ECF subfamily